MLPCNIRHLLIPSYLMSLREMRKAVGLTQVELATILDVDPTTIVRWERGYTEPSPSNIRRLAWTLRADESDVLKAVLCAKQAV